MIEQYQIQISNVSTRSRSKRSVSHRRKFSRKLPLIRKELKIETNVKQSTERLVKIVMDCDYMGLRKHIENGMNVNMKFNNWTLLHYACSMIDSTLSGSEEHLEIIRLLLDNGAGVNAQDEDGWTPLHLACQLGITRIISYLIRKGADKEACTIENLRPIDLVEPDNFIALSLLISNNINVIISNERLL